MEAQTTVRLVNAAGLHARPCHAIVSLAREYDCDLRVACGTREVDGRSILALMTLGAPVDSELCLSARGADAERLLEALSALVAGGFGERDSTETPPASEGDR